MEANKSVFAVLLQSPHEVGVEVLFLPSCRLTTPDGPFFRPQVVEAGALIGGEGDEGTVLAVHLPRIAPMWLPARYRLVKTVPGRRLLERQVHAGDLGSAEEVSGLKGDDAGSRHISSRVRGIGQGQSTGAPVMPVLY